MKRGYARISTDSQELGRQIDALQRYGCDQIYMDTMSGVKKNRPELDKMIVDLSPGDLVVIQKLDRLGRSMINLLELMHLFKSKGVQFVSLSESFDTTTPAGTMMFTMLGAFAQFERDIISERTKNALQFKKSQGTVLGRPSTDAQIIVQVVDAFIGGQKAEVIAKQYSITRKTVYNIVKRSKLKLQL